MGLNEILNRLSVKKAETLAAVRGRYDRLLGRVVRGEELSGDDEAKFGEAANALGKTPDDVKADAVRAEAGIASGNVRHLAFGYHGETLGPRTVAVYRVRQVEADAALAAMISANRAGSAEASRLTFVRAPDQSEAEFAALVATAEAFRAGKRWLVRDGVERRQLGTEGSGAAGFLTRLSDAVREGMDPAKFIPFPGFENDFPKMLREIGEARAKRLGHRTPTTAAPVGAPSRW